jgi:hypothetical protein
MCILRNAVRASELVWEKEMAMAMRNFWLGFLNIRASKRLLMGTTALQWIHIGLLYRP